MAAEDEGVPNPYTLSLEFRCPRWFRYNAAERFPGEICRYHEICAEVEHDLRRLRRQYQPQTAEEEKKEEEEILKKLAVQYRNRDKKFLALRQKKLDEALEKMKHDEEERMKHKEEKEDKRKYMMRRRKQKWRRKYKGKRKYVMRKMKRRMKNKKRKNKCRKYIYDDKSDTANFVGMTDFQRGVAEGKIKVWTFEEDSETYDLRSLLCGRTRNRKHLINNKGVQVDIGQLSGKYVLLYFLSLPNDQEPTGIHYHKSDPVVMGYLEELYNFYSPQEFEIVVVALGNNEHVFRDLFSLMPWLAIPHEDQEARDFFIEEFSIPFPSCIQAVLFAPSGKVVLKDAESSILYFGIHGFPFTKQRTITFADECRALQNELFLKSKIPELTALLGDYVISSHGNKEPTSKLEGKIVGLFFFEPTHVGFRQTRRLLETWKSLKQEQRAAFEIVFVNKPPFNLSDAKVEFKNKFKCAIPWYSIEVCGRKLSWIFQKEGGSLNDAAGDFIVLQPDAYQPVSYFAFDIMENFGSDAYPFTLQRAVKLAKRKQQNQLVLDELLSPEAFLLRGYSGGFEAYYGSTIRYKQLSGRRVLLLFATHSCYSSGLFLPRLKQMYFNMLGKFEIIYISLDCDESPSSFSKCIQEMPWWIHAFNPDFAVALAQLVFDVFPPRLPAIAAFGPDGHLEAKESNLAFKKDWNYRYPFIEADLDKAVYVELINQYNWDLCQRIYLRPLQA